MFTFFFPLHAANKSFCAFTLLCWEFTSLHNDSGWNFWEIAKKIVELIWAICWYLTMMVKTGWTYLTIESFLMDKVIVEVCLKNVKWLIVIRNWMLLVNVLCIYSVFSWNSSSPSKHFLLTFQLECPKHNTHRPAANHPKTWHIMQIIPP